MHTMQRGSSCTTLPLRSCLVKQGSFITHLMVNPMVNHPQLRFILCISVYSIFSYYAIINPIVRVIMVYARFYTSQFITLGDGMWWFIALGLRQHILVYELHGSAWYLNGVLQCCRLVFRGILKNIALGAREAAIRFTMMWWPEPAKGDFHKPWWMVYYQKRKIPTIWRREKTRQIKW